MARFPRRIIFASIALTAAIAIGWGAISRPTVSASVSVSPTAADSAADVLDEDMVPFQFRVPSGNPSEVSCAQLQTIIHQVDDTLAYTPDDVEGGELVDATLDWIDPHGLWGIAEDAPLGDFLSQRKEDLRKSLHLSTCALSDEAGVVTAAWATTLRNVLDESMRTSSGANAEVAATDTLPTNIKARTIAEEIGHRLGAIEKKYGAPMERYINAARDHFLPAIGDERWGNVVRAAIVRAYVPLVDPHGAWAPLDEEASLYEVELAANAPHALFGHIVPTVIGARVERVSSPFEEGDVVLDIGSVELAGLPLEQLDQMSYAIDTESSWKATVLRRDKIVTVHGGAHRDPAGDRNSDDDAKIETSRIPYGESEVVVVAVHDVRDDLGDDIASLVRDIHSSSSKPAGIVLDLRGNGGGSTDGAAEALATFLPGVTLFPMKRRDGTIEVERAPEPPVEEQWAGPVAAIVDGGTASAAEMISGAFLAYERGIVVGAPTFGKGCAQEYLDDDTRNGVLRLTTLVYALPNGDPVQRVGLQPLVRLPFEAKGGVGPNEREARLAHSAKAWRGPDVRDPAHKSWFTPWPANGGKVGPCAEEDLCRALRAIAPLSPRHSPVAKKP